MILEQLLIPFFHAQISLHFIYNEIKLSKYNKKKSYLP